MELITEKPETTFNVDAVKVGNVIYAKHFSWEDGKAGYITSATEKLLIVQFHPGIGNVTNHFFIPIAEVVAGDWQIRWSVDLTEVYEYPLPQDDTEQATEGS